MTLPEIKAFYTLEMMEKLNGVQLDVCTKIIDGQKFVETCIETLEENSGKKEYLHIYEKLYKSVNIIRNCYYGLQFGDSNFTVLKDETKWKIK